MSMDYQEVLERTADNLRDVVAESWVSRDTMHALLTTSSGFGAVPNRSETFTRFGAMICTAAINKAVDRLDPTIVAVMRDKRSQTRLMEHLVRSGRLLGDDYNVMVQFLLNCYNQSALSVDLGSSYSVRLASLQTRLNAARIDPNAKIDRDTLDQEILDTLNEYRSLTTDHVDSSSVLSYRVSPIGRTPAFADTQNLSTMRYHIQKYLKLKTDLLDSYYTIRHYSLAPETPEPAGFFSLDDEGGYRFEGTPHRYTSTSDGQYLTRSMYIRHLVYNMYRKFITDDCYQIKSGIPMLLGVYPRLHSITVVVDKRLASATDVLIPDIFEKKDPRAS